MNRRAVGTFSRTLCSNFCRSSSLDAYLLCRSRCQHALIKTALPSPKFSLPSPKFSRHLSLSLPCLTSEINNVDDPEQQQTSPTDNTQKVLKDNLMQRILERGTELSLIIKMTEVSVENLFMTEDGDFESGYFISCIQKLASNGEIDSQWHYLMENFEGRWNDYAADFMLRRKEFLNIKDCFPPSVLSHLSPELKQHTKVILSLKRFDEQHIYQHMEWKKAKLVVKEVEKLVNEEHPKLRNAVFNIVKDAVEDLKIWKRHFEWSCSGFRVYKDVIVKLIQMKNLPDAYFILQRYDSEVLFTYMMRKMMARIVEATVIHANDPKEAWSYTDRIIQLLHIKDNYRESDMTKEQHIFMSTLMDTYIKTLFSRFPAKSAVQTFFDVYHLYPSIFSLKIFFVLYNLIGAKELELIQKVMTVSQEYVMGNEVSIFTSLFCALIMRARYEDAKKVLKDKNLLIQCNRTVIYECIYFLAEHKMDVALVHLCELTKDMKFLDRSSMLNALGTVHDQSVSGPTTAKIMSQMVPPLTNFFRTTSDRDKPKLQRDLEGPSACNWSSVVTSRCKDSEKAYEVFLELHNNGQKISGRLVNSLVYSYQQRPVPELLRPYSAKVRNTTFLSSKRQSGDADEDYNEDVDDYGAP